MKKIITLVVMIAMLVSMGCAGMSPTHNRNMATNAIGYGALGAAAGAVFGGAKGAAIGAAAGAAMGAANTPLPAGERGAVIERYRGSRCGSFYSPGEQAACERGIAQAERRLQRARERRAYQYGRSGGLLFRLW